MSNIIAIVGRPNVGKSTLFNRLTGRRDAIIDETSGTTRDRNYGRSDWNGIEFSVIDTGGYVDNSEDIFEEEINKQVKIAIEESDVILFLVDVTTGVTDLDASVAEILRKSKKTVYLVVNKVDTNDRICDSHEFYKLGLGELFCISSINGSGTGEILDEVVKHFKPEEESTEPNVPRIAVVGRPNVGKSSFINALIGEERNIVTEIAGTTRDSIHTRYTKFGQDFYLIDTAGLRKKGKVTDDLEFYSVMRSIRSIELSDICMLILDASQDMESQDVNILHLAQKNRKGIVILVNKWDLIEKDTKSTLEFEEKIKRKIAPFSDVPIIFISALTKQRIHKAVETAMEVFNNRKQRISTSKLNDIMLKAIEDNQPPALKGKHIKIKYVTQLPTPFPCFAFFCNLPQYIKDPYKRYLENKIRQTFNFSGVPIEIFMRKK
ncbi:MAG: ribosome biogenesis GTPase Der [Bacteroidetes bacterium GWA2_31_9]|nr:MAG: ribosome biogenesis GTPase Der [Bacteroidetes bacterium GWA2_31_9]